MYFAITHKDYIIALAQKYGKVSSLSENDNGDIVIFIDGGILLCYEHKLNRITIDDTTSSAEVSIAL